MTDLTEKQQKQVKALSEAFGVTDLGVLDDGLRRAHLSYLDKRRTSIPASVKAISIVKIKEMRAVVGAACELKAKDVV